jgi:hypothetical protein
MLLIQESGSLADYYEQKYLGEMMIRMSTPSG